MAEKKVSKIFFIFVILIKKYFEVIYFKKFN